MSIKGLIFDFDGLILDTETPEFRIWQDIFGSYGLQLSLEVWSKQLGTSSDTFDLVVHLGKQLGREFTPEEAAQIVDLKKQQISNKLFQQSPLPGVREYFESAKRIGLRLGIATSSSFAWVSGHLFRLGLMDYPECIRTADDVQQVKPHPELYQCALQCLSLQPDEAIAFEDSPNGVTAAKTAGIFTVAVPLPLTQSLNFSHADLVLKSLADLPLEELLSQAEKRISELSI